MFRPILRKTSDVLLPDLVVESHAWVWLGLNLDEGFVSLGGRANPLFWVSVVVVTREFPVSQWRVVIAPEIGDLGLRSSLLETDPEVLLHEASTWHEGDTWEALGLGLQADVVVVALGRGLDPLSRVSIERIICKLPVPVGRVVIAPVVGDHFLLLVLYKRLFP